MAVRVSAEDFDAKVLQSELPAIVEFYSDSCIPCKQLSPILGGIEDDYEDKVNVYKVNVNFDAELAEKYAVMAFRVPSRSRRMRSTIYQMQEARLYL